MLRKYGTAIAVMIDILVLVAVLAFPFMGQYTGAEQLGLLLDKIGLCDVAHPANTTGNLIQSLYVLLCVWLLATTAIKGLHYAADPKNKELCESMMFRCVFCGILVGVVGGGCGAMIEIARNKLKEIKPDYMQILIWGGINFLMGIVMFLANICNCETANANGIKTDVEIDEES